MKKLLRTFMLAVLFLPFALQAQNTLTVADGTTTNSNVPVYGLYVDDFVRCQTIYPAATIDAAATTFGMNGGSITSLTYYLSSPAAASWGDASFVVNIKEVDATTLTAFVDMTDATTVYTGSLDGTQSTMTITFTTPYTYQGGNLLIEIYNTLEGTYKSASFYGVTASGASWQGYNSSAWTSVTGSVKNFMPKTTFTFTGGSEITCRPVQTLAIDATQTTSSSLTLTWADALNAGATYTVYDMADNTVIESGITANTYTVSGLDANTEYTFGVEANCSATDAAIMMTVSGRTACAAISVLPFEEGFESVPSGNYQMPYCWSRYASAYTSTAVYPFSNNSNAHSDSRSLYFYGTTGSSYSDTMVAIMPELDVNLYPMNGNRVTFWAKMGTATASKMVYVGTMTDPTDISTFVIVDSVSVSGNTYKLYSAPLTDATSTAPYVAFMVLKGTGTMYIDDVTLEEMPACLEVTNLTVTGTTANTITLSWADDANPGASYTIYNMADTSSIVNNVDGLTYTVENLTANTQYTFGVEANCSAGDGAIITVSGRTECDAFDAPHTWDFEDQTSGTPDCWTKVGNGTAAVTNSTSYAHAGSYYLKFSGSTSNLILLPETQDEISTLQVRFWTRPESFSSTNCGTFSVGYVTDATNDSSFVEMANYAYSDFSAYDEKTVTFTDAPAGARMAMRHNANATNWYWYVDDVTIEEIPSCPAVAGLALDGQTASTASIHWNDNGSTGYDVEVRQNDVALTDVTVVVTDTTAEISGLTVDNDYQIVVRSICGSDYGQWCNPLNIHIGYCTPSPTSVDNNGITSVSFGGMTNTTTHPSASPYYGNYVDMIGTVPAGLPTNVEITYATGYTYGTIIWVDWNNSLSFDADEVVYRGTSLSTNPTTLTATFDVPVTAAGGSYRMRIAGADSYFDSYVSNPASTPNPCFSSTYAIAEDYTLMVGDAPACLPVTNLTADTVTAHEATLTWESDASSFNVYDMNDTTTVVASVNTNTCDLTNLTSETSYTFGVRTVCGSEESPFTTVSFTTLISCPVPTALAAVLTPGDGTVATLNWTENGTAEAWQICLNGDSTNLIDVYNTPTYDLTNLTPETPYTAMVRANCGDADGNSAWSTTITFTPTNSYSVTVNDSTATNGYVPIYGYWVDNITKSQFIIPASDLAAMQFGTVNKLTFYASQANVNWGAAEFNVYMTETNETTVSALADYSTMTQVYAGSLSISGNKMEVTFTNPYLYMGGNLMIGFLQTVSGTFGTSTWYGINANGASMGGYGSSISQRNFLPKTTIDYTPGEAPSCLPVSNLTVSDITSNGATLTWTGSSADSYSVIDLSDSSVVATVSTETCDLTNLDPMTHYTIGVVANCGSNQSLMVTVSFNTACTAVDLPYTETFASTSSTRDCWNLVSMNTGNDVGTSNGMGFVTVNGHDVLRFSSYSNHGGSNDYNQYGFSPLMNVSSSATNLMVSVVYATYGSDDLLYFGYVTPTDTVWDPTAYTTNSGTTPSTWETATFIVPANATQVAIHYYGNYKFYGWIDTVNVIEMTGDYCYAVTNLTADNSTTSSISLSWSDDNNTGATYTVYNMADNTVIATGVSGNSYVVTGLTASTSYTFGVVANCSATSEADIVTVNAMTDCADITALPYNEGFENGLGCWTTVNGSTDGNPWNAQGSFSSPAITPHTGNGMAASWSWNNSAMHANAWLISPKFVLPNTTEGLTLTWWERANPYYSDSYSVVLSTTTNDTAAFTTVIRPYDTTAGEWTQQTVDLSAYAGQSIYIAFHHVDYNMNYLLIDDIALTGGSSTTDSLTINLSINNPTLGTINPLPGTYHVALNDSLVFSATPAAGATFDGWKISVGTQTIGTIPINPFTLPVNQNNIAFGELNVVAMFSDSTSAPDSMTVIINTADATMGTTNPAPGTYNLAVGSQTFVTAIPNDGYQLLYWIESMTVGDITVTDTLLADTIIVTVIPIMAGITSSLTACFEAIPVQPCAVPTGLTATAIHNESIELAWDNADVEGWNIQWRVGTGTWASAHTTNNNYTITGLTGLTTYEIQVQADCGDGNLSDWSNSITATTTNVGIENFTDLKVTLFPNPAREYVDIRIDGNANVTAMEVFDVYGKLINTVNVIDNLTRINVNGLADGMYFVRVTTDNGTVTKTFVKK